MGVRAYDKPIHEGFFYVLVDLKDDSTKTPDVFIVPSTKLKGLLDPYPKGVKPGSGKLTDVWCVIDRKHSPAYKEKWEAIGDALA